MLKRKPAFLPAHYDELAQALWNACEDYLRRANEALSAASFEPPALTQNALIMLPHSGIKSIRTDGKDRFDLEWPFVAVEIDDPSHPGERKERYFDPWYFVAMQLFALSGCKIGLFDSKKIQGEPPAMVCGVSRAASTPPHHCEHPRRARHTSAPPDC